MVAALQDAYIKAADYRSLRGMTGSDNDKRIDDDLLAISRYLDIRIGRHFTKDASPVARAFIIGGRYTPTTEKGKVLYLPDFAGDPTSIKIDEDDDGSFADETALVAADYQNLPLNAALEPELQPYDSIRLTEWGDKSVWPNGSMVEITAQWGWPAVPEAIIRSTADIAALLRIEGIRSTNRIQEGIDGAIMASAPAQTIIWDMALAYRRESYR